MPRTAVALIPGKPESMSRRVFPVWGVAGIPVGVFIGMVAGGGVGTWFGSPGIGAIIGAALGVSAGMALLAAAIVIASARWR